MYSIDFKNYLIIIKIWNSLSSFSLQFIYRKSSLKAQKERPDRQKHLKLGGPREHSLSSCMRSVITSTTCHTH